MLNLLGIKPPAFTGTEAAVGCLFCNSRYWRQSSDHHADVMNMKQRIATILLALVMVACASAGEKYCFLVAGDPQYLAEKTASPSRLDPYSEAANRRAIALLQEFAGRSIPKDHGSGTVSKRILGLINTGDLIDSADKSGGNYPAMQKFEWQRFKSAYGLTGKDGLLPFPVYEVHGNHDGPQGDTFIIDDIVARNARRPGIRNRSANGLHYSWDWGPLHCINLGMFVGAGEERRRDHHYAPRASLEFLRKDLREQVGNSRRPIIVSFHLHPNGPEYDWPEEDLAAFWQAISAYNVIALFHGHTHGSPPSRTRWNGRSFAKNLADGVDVFNPDDIGAAKTDRKNPQQGVGLRHGFLYVELIDNEGIERDRFIVRSYATRDNWATHDWHTTWSRSVNVPD